ncbi:MAG: CPBP family intramembrane glutamic endopeptidase [Pirellulaceae bacterium]
MIADAAALVFALVLPTLVTLAYFVWLAEAGVAQRVVYGVGKLVQFTFPLAWMLLAGRPALELSLMSGQGGWLGLAFGALVAVAMFVLYGVLLKPRGFFDGRVRQEAVAKIRQFGITTLPRYAALGVFYALGHSLLEEYYWRWFVFDRCASLMHLGPAIAVSSLGFMAHHVILLGVYFGWRSPTTYVFSLAVGVGGAAWAWLYADSGSLLGPWLSHLLIDAAIFAIGYDVARDSFE